MRKKIFGLLVCAAISISFTSVSFAKDSIEAFLISENGDMNIRVELSDEYIGKEMLLYIFNPGKNISDTAYLNYAANLEAFQYVGQTEYVSDGVTFDFRMNTDNVSEDAGNIYTMYAVTMDKEKSLSGKFTYYEKDIRSSIIDELNSNVTADTARKAYEGFSMQNLEVFNSLKDLNKLASILNTFIRNEGPANSSNVQGLITKAALVLAAEEGVLGFDEIIEYNSLIGLEKEYTDEFSNLNTDGKKLLGSSLMGISCRDMNELKTELQKSLLASLVFENVLEGSGTLESVIERHKSFFSNNGLDYAMYQKSEKDTIGRKIIADGVKKFDDMVKAINEASKGTSGSDSSGGRGYNGGGGKKGGSENSTPIISAVTPKEEKVTFSDLESVEWARESIEKLFGLGIIKGKADGVFAPSDNVTREEFVKIIMGAFEMPFKNSEVIFKDVLPGRWSYEAVCGAAEIGIVSGYDGLFRPSDTITREDMAVIIVRALKYKNNNLFAEEYETGFSDGNEISDYAKESVNVLSRNGLISGTGDNMFSPKKSATRAEAAVMICNAMEYKEM